ncbi:MAG: HAD-IIA family hydrolase [Candidatus Izemoplasmatales bacterium]
MKPYKLFLLDMDGTIYLGNQLFPYVKEMLSTIAYNQGKVKYITNNSSKSVSAYIDKLNHFGISTTKEDFYTSSMATARYLKNHHKDALVYLVGTTSLKEELEQEGILVTESIEDSIGVILIGYDTELTYQKLYDITYLLTKRDLPYIATNPDKTCPTEFGFVPDCGSFVDMIENATKKRPFFIGKPNPMMIDYAIQTTPFSKEETLVIGDRLHTDILSGINASVDTCLVLTGESTIEEANTTVFPPKYIFNTIGDVYEAYKKAIK